MRNVIMHEAVSNMTSGKVTKMVSEIKKKMQTCKLTKFASPDSCSSFFSSFFLGELDLDVPNDDPITLQDWGTVYNQLINDYVFIENLSLYSVIYKPKNTASMFKFLYNIAVIEASNSSKYKVSIYGKAKAIFSMIQLGFDHIRVSVNRQVVDHGDLKLLSVIDQTLSQYQMKLEKRIQSELQTQVKVDDVSRVEATPAIDPDSIRSSLQEDSHELMDLLEHADQWINQYIENDLESLDEAVISNAREKAKEMNLRKKKATAAFEELVTKKFREWQINRRNRKHSEAIGESLRIVRYIKRLLAIGGLSIIHPAIGIIAAIVTYFIDHATDKKDLNVLIGLVKDDIEIVEEKISMAERNGDDKAKIELMRYRQKLYREYERLNKVSFDKTRLMRNPN